MALRSSKSSKRPEKPRRSSKLPPHGRPTGSDKEPVGTACQDTPSVPLARDGSNASRERPVADRARTHANPTTYYIKDVRKHPLLSHEDEYALGMEIASLQTALLNAVETLKQCWAPHHDCLPDLWPLCHRLNASQRWNPSLWTTLTQALQAHPLPFSSDHPIHHDTTVILTEICATHARWTVAREHLIEANLRLVISIAHTYRSILPISDLIQIGNIGLMHAVDRFDPSQGTRLSTYSVMWIREAMSRAVNSANQHTQPLMYQSSEEHDPCDIQATITSLDNTASVLDDFELNRFELLRDTQTNTPEEEAIEEELRRRIRESLLQLPPIQQTIIDLRHGLTLPQELTLEEIANRLGLKRDQVRHLQNKAYKALEHGPFRHILQEFLHE